MFARIAIQIHMILYIIIENHLKMKEHVGMESQKSNMVWVRGYRTP
jgi:hypothetical protein